MGAAATSRWGSSHQLRVEKETANTKRMHLVTQPCHQDELNKRNLKQRTARIMAVSSKALEVTLPKVAAREPDHNLNSEKSQATWTINQMEFQ